MVRALGVTVITSVIRRQCSFVIQMIPKSCVKVLIQNVAMSYNPFEGCFLEEGYPQGRLMVMRERRWWKKRMTFCSRKYTGSNFARHESELTS